MSPIKAENKTRYPNNWKQIRAQILARAGNRCEFCGVENKAWGYRTRQGSFCELWKGRLVSLGCQRPPFVLLSGVPPYCARVVEIVLTIAHLDQRPENCEPGNLRALCQRCHLGWDRESSLVKAGATRQEKGRQLRIL
jgi:hypothetical protein